MNHRVSHDQIREDDRMTLLHHVKKEDSTSESYKLKEKGFSFYKNKYILETKMKENNMNTKQSGRKRFRINASAII